MGGEGGSLKRKAEIQEKAWKKCKKKEEKKWINEIKERKGRKIKIKMWFTGSPISVVYPEE